MKKFLTASLGALMLAGMIGGAQAATTDAQVNPAPIASTTTATPFRTNLAGSEQLPAFDYSRATPVVSNADPVLASNAADPADPVSAASGSLNVSGSQALPSFNTNSAVTVSSSVEGVGHITPLGASTGVASLVNRAGSGR